MSGRGAAEKQWTGAQSMSSETRRAMAGGLHCFLNTRRVWGRREEEWETGCHLEGGTGASKRHISERRGGGQTGSELMLVSCEAGWKLAHGRGGVGKKVGKNESRAHPR